MRKLILIVFVLLSGPSLAELIDNDGYVTDTESGLDWLDLTETSGMSWTQAGDKFPDWRHASYEEIRALFPQLFPGYDLKKSKMESMLNTYEGQLDDVHRFNKLFGFTFISEAETFTLGLYQTPDAGVTGMGAREFFGSGRREPARNIIFGPLWRPYEPYTKDSMEPNAGIYMVRPTAAASTAVAEPR